jgi:tetratricopeptide (TPR) repeat protein
LKLRLTIRFSLSLIAMFAWAFLPAHAQTGAYGTTSVNNTGGQYTNMQNGVSNDPMNPNNSAATYGGLINQLNPITPLNGGAGSEGYGRNGNTSGANSPFLIPGAHGQSLGVYGEKAPERGWPALAKLLEAITPSVDTRIPPTPSDLTTRYQYLLDNRRYDEALKEISARLLVEQNRKTPGTDVQLMFLYARALAYADRTAEAEGIYQQMTTRYPELPEPWNNLAALYVSRGELDQAKRALDMAIMINPGYGVAQANLGDVYMLLALKAYQAANASKVVGIAAKLENAKEILDPPLTGGRSLKSKQKITQFNMGIRRAIDLYLEKNFISQRF